MKIAFRNGKFVPLEDEVRRAPVNAEAQFDMIDVFDRGEIEILQSMPYEKPGFVDPEDRDESEAADHEGAVDDYNRDENGRFASK